MTLLRQAARKLGKSPGFTAIAILTLAVGIGANTAIFSLIESVLLTPPPFPQPDRLVALRCKQPAMTWAVVADFHEYLDWKEQTDLFSDVMLYQGFGSQVLVDGPNVRSLAVHSATDNYLRTLGLRPALGRDLTAADCAPGAAPVALLGHSAWKSQFNGDPAVVGRGIKLGGRMVTVVGVLPAGFRSVTPDERLVDALMPLAVTRGSAPRGNHSYWAIARLRDGIPLEQARARLNDVATRLQQQHGHTHGIITFSLAEWSTQWVRPRLFALMGSVALVLLIACVNLANLQLVRITGRTAEISIKMAIGASRGQVTRELLAESLLLGLAGGVLGATLAGGLLWLAEDFLKSQFSTFASVRLGGLALVFSAGVTLLAVALSSLVPAWRATSSFEQFMRAIGRSAVASPQQRRLSNLFIVAQVGLTLLVLVSAGLLVRSMHRLITQEKGFAVEHIAVMRVALPQATYADEASRVRFYDALLARLRALPGIESVAAGDSIPLRTNSNGYFSVPGIDWPKGQEPLADKLVVSPGYFSTFGISLLKGRDFDANLDRRPEGEGRFSASIIINDAFARKYFPGRDPIGQRVAWGSDRANQESNYTWDTVIGVVADARMVSLDREVGPAMYAPHTQAAWGLNYFAARTRLDPAALLPMFREQLRALDPGLPLTAVRPMRLYVDDLLAQRKLITWTIAAAALTSLLLAVLGLYSVVAYTVAQQTREIGVRMALGAAPGNIRDWVLKRGVVLVAFGIAAGAGASALVSRMLGSLIYDISAWDPATYGSVAALLGLTALLACWLPARRAARVDPLVALRAE